MLIEVLTARCRTALSGLVPWRTSRISKMSIAFCTTKPTVTTTARSTLPPAGSSVFASIKPGSMATISFSRLFCSSPTLIPRISLISRDTNSQRLWLYLTFQLRDRSSTHSCARRCRTPLDPRRGQAYARSLHLV